MRADYDIVVVGAGPAGSMAAQVASQQGARVALLEKDGEIGIPVRCAEATSEVDLQRLIEIQPQWIANYVTRARLFAPTLQSVEIPLPSRGIILHRRLFDSGLAEAAARAGVEVFTKAYVSGVDFNRQPPLVTVNYRQEVKQIRAKIVIAADGVESRVARWAGIRTQTVLKDIESCAQYLMGNLETVTDSIDFYFSSRWAPGGYAWVFPKGKSVANVGLGVNCAWRNTYTPLAHLDAFCQELFPQGTRLATVVGGVPVAQTLKQIVADHLLVVGDAARQANPVTGGGILAAITAGQLAGTVAAEAIKKNTYRAEFLMRYQRAWARTVGRDYARFYKIKEWMLTLKDDDLNHIADSLQQYAPGDLSLLTVFKVALTKHPRLLWLALKLFAGYK